MLNRTEKFRFFGFSFVALMGMVFLFNFIWHYPVRFERSEEKRIELGKKFGKKAIDIEDDINNAEQTYNAIREKLDRIPGFKPPSDNHLTEDQINKYRGVVDHCWDRLRSYRRDYVKNLPEGVARGFAIAAQGSIILQLCRIEGLAEEKMTEEEFNWVKKQIWEAALFAVNRKFESGKVRPEEKASLSDIRERLCWGLLLYKETDKVEYFPEKLDTSRIPRHNVELFLRFKNEIRWRRISFEQMEFDYQDIMNAAQALPE